MTDSTMIIVAAIAALPATIAAWSGYKNGRKIDEVHKTTNSRLDQLLEASKAKFHAEGMAAQRELDKPK